jgi:Tol biopolymer transport system component
VSVGAARLAIGVVLCVTGGWVPSSHAQIVTQVTDVKPSYFEWPRLTEDGTAVFVLTTADLVGRNPRHRWHVFRFDLTSSDVEQVTRFAQGVLREDGTTIGIVYASPAVSDDGDRIAFVSRDDLTGANPDFGPEVYVMGVDGSALVQLTNGGADGAIGQMRMAGGGSRIVFDADFDYTGGNPDRRSRVFIVDDDGSNLTQLTTAEGGLPSISDDGERVVFADGNWPSGVDAVEASGAGHRVLTGSFSWPMAINGDGSTVVYLGLGLEQAAAAPSETPAPAPLGSPHPCPDADTVQVGGVDWDASDQTWLTCVETGAVTHGSAFSADVTDDGQTIFYTSEDVSGAVSRIERDGSGATPLVPSFLLCPRVAVSGAGDRIAITCSESFRADDVELYTADGDGDDLERLTDTPARGGHSRHAAQTRTPSPRSHIRACSSMRRRPTDPAWTG